MRQAVTMNNAKNNTRTIKRKTNTSECIIYSIRCNVLITYIRTMQYFTQYK